VKYFPHGPVTLAQDLNNCIPNKLQHSMSRYEVETHPVLPSPQRQNMPNCASECAKQDKNMPRFFRNKKTTGK